MKSPQVAVTLPGENYQLFFVCESVIDAKILCQL